MSRDGASMGRAAGALLADMLLRRADDGARAGLVGAHRMGREVKRVQLATHTEAGAWLQTIGLVEAFVVDMTADEVRVLVPAEAGGAFDIVWRLRFVVDAQGNVMTTEPAFTVSDGADELLDDFNDGVAAGLELHPRTRELRDGFGALGAYEDWRAS